MEKEIQRLKMFIDNKNISQELREKAQKKLDILLNKKDILK